MGTGGHGGRQPLPEGPSVGYPPYTLEQLMAEFTQVSRRVRAVQVHERRPHYIISGCSAEMTEVVADGQPTRTVAVEFEDPARVLAAVREMALEGFENISYPRGLKAPARSAPPEGPRMARYAVIDVGTNSVKFHIGEKHADGTWTTVVDRAEVTRLGEGLAATGGEFTPQAMERTIAAIAGMAAEANAGAPLPSPRWAPWACARRATARPSSPRSTRRCGVRIEVITGEEEGRLAYLAVKSGLGLGDGSMVIFDTGGGSSQFTFGAVRR